MSQDKDQPKAGNREVTAASKRIESLLAQMTLAEKVAMMSGKDFWNVGGIPRLGIPDLSVSDGPTGLRSVNSDPATVFPVGVAFAATWDRQLVQDMSAAIGREAIAYGVDVLLAPTVNIQRTPLGGRNFECYSEDPLLSSEIGIAYVDGVQSQGVGTSLKHYAANNQEHERMRGSSNVPIRALREIYLSSFEPVIRRAKPWTVMGAYNRVNGVFACENDFLLNHVLRDEWGYDGVVVSDWGGTKSTVDACNSGLDLEMPGPPRQFGQALIAAVEAGQVSQATIDEHVRRLLRLFDRCGLLDGNPKSSRGALATPEHRQLARKAAADSMVLLKNERSLLPLRGVKRVAIIGAIADGPAIQGGGSSQVSPDRIVTPLEGLRAALGESVEILFERGIDHEPRPPVIDGRLLSPKIGSPENGLKARYFNKTNFGGKPVHEETDWRFNKLGFGAVAQSSEDLSFSVEWTGFITPRYSGIHDFAMSHSNPNVELIIGNDTLVGNGTPRKSELLFMILPLNLRRARMELEAGRSYPITIRYSQPTEQAIRAFNIFSVSMREPAPSLDSAMEAAAVSDVAIVFVGSGTTSETEGLDRASMKLGQGQDSLVQGVLAANPNTVVVINSGAPIEMPWADDVPAILQMWMPGQEGGHALADVLSGKVNPSGKLPVSFPRRYEDNPTFLHYPGNMQADYGEGQFVGYRYYDKMGIDPLFAFGHGLSYSRFTLSNLYTPETVKAGETLNLSIDLKNEGDVEGAETVQIYVEDLATKEAMPLRQLRGFEKVVLPAGSSCTLFVELPARAFSWFDPDADNWAITPGRYRIHAGTSSRDLPLSAELVLSA